MTTTGRDELRYRIAKALLPHNDWGGEGLNINQAADAVLAVLPAPADRATDRRGRYTEAIKGALPLTTKAIDAAMAVADTEIQEATELAAGLGMQNMRLKAALAPFHCTACGGEGGGGTEDPDVWIPCDTCHGTGLHTDPTTVLREEAARIRSHCPDHADSDSTPGAWMACHCAVADDIERRTADQARQAEPAAEQLVHVGWWCWRGDNHGHLATTACRSDNVPLHAPAEWADDMRAVIQRIDDGDEEPQP